MVVPSKPGTLARPAGAGAAVAPGAGAAVVIGAAAARYMRFLPTAVQVSPETTAPSFLHDWPALGGLAAANAGRAGKTSAPTAPSTTAVLIDRFMAIRS